MLGSAFMLSLSWCGSACGRRARGACRGCAGPTARGGRSLRDGESQGSVRMSLTVTSTSGSADRSVSAAWSSHSHSLAQWEVSMRYGVPPRRAADSRASLAGWWRRSEVM